MAEYFSHDYDTRSDEKIMDLMAEMSWAGYGLFWGIVELLYQNDGTLQRQYKRIAFALGSNESSVQSIVEDFNLFSINDTEFWSESLNKRLDERVKKSEKARESANIGWEKRKKNANAKRTQSDSNAKKESKVYNSIVNKKNIPAWEEFEKYGIEKKPNIDTLALKLKYESWVEAGWIDGHGNKIINWKSKLLNTLQYIKDKPESKNLYPGYKDSSFD